MHVHLVRRLATLAAIVLLIGFAGPLATAWADCPGNVAPNAGFEEGFSDRGATQVHVANGWNPFWQEGPYTVGDQGGFNVRPDFGAEDAVRYGRRRVHGGDWGQKWSSQYATHHAGVYQQVSVATGSRVTVRAWGQAWSSQEDKPETSKEGNYRLSVGIDPTGGTNWAAGSVIWSSSNALDQWVELTAQATAAGGAVTIFLRGDCEYRNKHNDAYWDDVCVTVETPPTPKPKPTNTPQPTSTATLTPTLSFTATPEPSPTPPGATLRVGAFDDRDGNSLRAADEPLVAGAGVRILDAQQRIVAQEKLDGQELRVFADLPAGSYSVIEENAAGYRSVSADQLIVSVSPGGDVEVLFADAVAPPTSAPPVVAPTVLPSTLAPTVALPTPRPPTPAPARTGGSRGTGLWGISGLLLAVAALGLAAGLLVMRRR